jgi:ketosteroid isomerase-like protein
MFDLGRCGEEDAMLKRIQEAANDDNGTRRGEPSRAARLSRRAVIAGAVAAPLATAAAAGTGMARGSRGSASARDVTDLVRRTEQAAAALIRGDINAYLELIRHADDYTLMQPFGGSPTRGFDARPESLAALARFFKGGESTLEVTQSYASGDLVVLVVIERQHGAVGDLPDQEWSLRVTQVYRRSGAAWELVHRHADPLVHPIGIDRAAALARG